VVMKTREEIEGRFKRAINVVLRISSVFILLPSAVFGIVADSLWVFWASSVGFISIIATISIVGNAVVEALLDGLELKKSDP